MKKIVSLTENDIRRIVKRVMNEALGLLDGDSDTPKSGRKMPKQYPTKHIKSREDAFYYTKGTKISARVLFDMYMKGTDIEVIMNPDNVTGPNGRHKKLFVLSTGQVYNELDEYMGNYKKEGFDKFEDYLES